MPVFSPLQPAGGSPESVTRRWIRNEHGADLDKSGWLVDGMCLLALLVGKTWRREGLPGLALLVSSHSVLAFGLVALIALRRHVYVQHRELLFTAGSAHLMWAVMQLALRGGDNILQYHRGSAALLFGLLSIYSPALWMFILALQGRLDLRWVRWAVPLLAVMPLRRTPAMCRRLLQAPGVQSPLARLYTNVSLMHSALLPPTALQMATHGWQGPMQMCAALNAWQLLTFGVALPLLLLHHLEQRGLRRRARRRREGQPQLSLPLSACLTSCAIWFAADCLCSLAVLWLQDL